MSRHCKVSARFCAPPPELARYVTTFYLAEIDVAEGGSAIDFLHPEWANLRFSNAPVLNATSRKGDAIDGCSFAVTGPSSQALRFEVSSCRIWGVGLMPLGWARFVRLPAADLADAVLDGHQHPAFAGFHALAANLFGDQADADAELARLTAHFSACMQDDVADDARIMALHAALIDPEIITMAELSERVGASARTIERLCDNAFGFSPKLLLRRQRFLRSLSHYMLDPSLKWIGALDGHYHDQAQFAREFRQFMGMSPRDYARLDHPILNAFVAARAKAAGAAMQALDDPRGALRGG